jgi:uncharacterized RDD family membrane protein YckC
MEVYVEKNRERTGPFTADQIVEMIKDGSLAPTQLVWHEQLSEWQLASNVFDFSQAGTTKRGAEKAIAAAKAEEKKVEEFSFSFDRRRSSVEDDKGEPASERLAGRGMRLAAVLLDSAIAGMAAAPGIVLVAPSYVAHTRGPMLLLGGAVMFLGLLAIAIVQIVLLSKHGQTIGKKVLKVRIVRADDGGYPGFVKAVLLRAFVPALIGGVPAAGSIFSIVDILFIFRSDRRCIHDLIAGTRVVAAVE